MRGPAAFGRRAGRLAPHGVTLPAAGLIGLITTECNGSSPRPSPGAQGRATHEQSGLTRGQHLQFLGEPLSGDVETSLDGADGRMELVGHLDQALATEVERHERATIHVGEPVQTDVQLLASLIRQHSCQRGLSRFVAGRCNALDIQGCHGAAAHGPIDSHPRGDGADPAAKAGGILQLVELAQGLDEHVLAQFLGFRVVAESSVGCDVHRPLELPEELLESIPATVLSGRDQLGQILLLEDRCGGLSKHRLWISSCSLLGIRTRNAAWDRASWDQACNRLHPGRLGRGSRKSLPSQAEDSDPVLIQILPGSIARHGLGLCHISPKRFIFEPRGRPNVPAA